MQALLSVSPLVGEMASARGGTSPANAKRAGTNADPFQSIFPLDSKRLFKLRQSFEQIRDEAIVGDLEDRGFLVLVDGDDDLRVLHAGEVLDGTGNAAGDVEFGCHDLAGLADLPVVRGVACVDGSA